MSENKYPIGGYAPEEKGIKRYTAEEVVNIQSKAYQQGYNEGWAAQKKEPKPSGGTCEPDFIEFIKNERSAISNEMLSDEWWLTIPPSKRVVIENILIAYDQMAEKLNGIKPAGAVWIKGDYDRLYDQLKADVNCRIVCYVDYNTRTKNPDGSPYVLRDICSIWGENMEFGSRGIGYGSVRFMPGDYKENFIELCRQMNVEWLDESGTASNNDAIEFAEWLRSNHHEPTFGNKWVNFSMSGSNRFTTAELHKLWQQSKEAKNA